MFTSSSVGGHSESKQKPVIVLKKKSRQEHESKEEEDDPFHIQPESSKSPKAKTSHRSGAERQKAQILLNNAKYNSGSFTS
jgi:hypothetical protein